MNRKVVFGLLLLSVGAIAALTANIIISRTRVHHLIIAAGSKQGESYILSQAVAQVVVKYDPQISIQVIETNGSEENVKLLEENKAQLATVQADIPPGAKAQIVCYLFPDLFQLVVTEKSGIKEISDLKGKRIALPPVGGGQYKSFWFLAKHYDLKSTDLQYTAMPEKAADAAFGNNEVDAVFRVRPPRNQSILELVQNRRGRLVAIDQAAAMKIKESAIDSASIPKGAYQGSPAIPPTDLPTVAVQRMLLASKDVDADIIKEITSILYSRRQELATAVPLANYIAPPTTVGSTGLPIHPGAQAYYEREKPNFIMEHSDYLGLLLTVALMVGSWSWELKIMLDRRQKNRADGYNEELIKLIEEINNSNDLKHIRQIRQDLFEILKKVVNDLDIDRISPDSFQSFTFTWETAMAVSRDREILIQSTHNVLPPLVPTALPGNATALPGNATALPGNEKGHSQL